MNLASSEAPLAARPRLRALLRLPRRRDEPVVSRPRPRQPPVEQPATPEEGYHFDDRPHRQGASSSSVTRKAIAPDKPFLMYFCPGARHAPHHAPKEWADKYKGKFDMGYEAYRELVFDRQKEMGILPEGRRALADQPVRRPKSRRRQAAGPSSTPCARGTRSPTTRSGCSARMAEVYAGFLSHADHQIGRLLDYLEEIGQLDNTIIVLVSDNGASGEGGPNGSVNENKFFNGVPDKIEENLQLPRRPRHARRPTTTTRPAGRGRSTRRSRCGSGTRTTRAARPTR